MSILFNERRVPPLILEGKNGGEWSTDWLADLPPIYSDNSGTNQDENDISFVHEDLPQKVDLNALFQMLDQRHKLHRQEIQTINQSQNSTWELVVIQAVLLVLLVAISILWAFCCRKRCIGVQPGIVHQVTALARKLSTSSTTRDLPPSYSKVDLTSVGLTLYDHYNPPPSYDWALEDTLEYSGPPPSPTPGNIRRYSRINGNNSRKSSVSSSLSRKTSRVTFADVLETGPTLLRNDTTFSLPGVPIILHPARKKSIKSAGSSRRVSFAEEGRKTSVVEPLDPAIEEELRKRLASLDDGILSEEDQIIDEADEILSEEEFNKLNESKLEIINEIEPIDEDRKTKKPQEDIVQIHTPPTASSLL